MEWIRRTQVAAVVCAVAIALCTAGWGKVYYVDADAVGAGDGSSWDDAFINPLDALNIATTGDEIHVAQGVYKPDRGASFVPPNRDATFALVDGVALLGGYAGVLAVAPDARDIDRYETILSGDLNGDDGPDFTNYDDNSRRGVVSVSGLVESSTMIEGFTITGGNGDEGGGIVCTESNLQVRQCKVLGNQAEGSGGGMISYGGTLVLTDCAFENNYAGYHGGGLSHEGGILSLAQCSWEGNEANGHGGGLYAVDTVVDLLQCTFHENAGLSDSPGRGRVVSSGGGMYIQPEDGSVCTNCSFVGNDTKSHGGGAYVRSTDVITFHNCSFEGNSAERGGGLANYFSDAIVMTDCVFRNNTAQKDGGGVHSQGDLSLTGCTFTGNIASRGGGLETTFSAPMLRDCVFEDNIAGETTGEPAFGGGAVYLNGPPSIPRRRGGNSLISNPGVPTFVGCRFAGNRAIGVPGGALYNGATEATLTNCVLVGNTASDGGGIYSYGFSTTLTYCTLAQNRSDGISGISDDISESVCDHCIVWGHDGAALSDSVSAIFSDIEGGWEGQGNIDVDPLFAAPGHWYSLIRPTDPNDYVWVDGDYHLMSQAGRWDPEAEAWVQDEVTSPCIDAGDPKGPIGDEPFPNGGIANLGAYGGSAEASKTYFGTDPAEIHMAGDINGDGTVGLADLLIVVLQWTEETTPAESEGRGR